MLRAVEYHPVSLATKQYQEHIHGIICTENRRRRGEGPKQHQKTARWWRRGVLARHRLGGEMVGLGLLCKRDTYTTYTPFEHRRGKPLEATHTSKGIEGSSKLRKNAGGKIDVI